MFELFRKKTPASSPEELKRLTAMAREEVKEKWIHYNKSVHLQPDIPLSEKINLFIQPTHQFFENKYSLLLSGPTEIFWLTVFTAILESGTHPKEAVNAAIAELKLKYARS